MSYNIIRQSIRTGKTKVIARCDCLVDAEDLMYTWVSHKWRGEEVDGIFCDYFVADETTIYAMIDAHIDSDGYVEYCSLKRF